MIFTATSVKKFIMHQSLLSPIFKAISKETVQPFWPLKKHNPVQSRKSSSSRTACALSQERHFKIADHTVKGKWSKLSRVHGSF